MIAGMIDQRPEGLKWGCWGPSAARLAGSAPSAGPRVLKDVETSLDLSSSTRSPGSRTRDRPGAGQCRGLDRSSPPRARRRGKGRCDPFGMTLRPNKSETPSHAPQRAQPEALARSTASVRLPRAQRARSPLGSFVRDELFPKRTTHHTTARSLCLSLATRPPNAMPRAHPPRMFQEGAPYNYQAQGKAREMKCVRKAGLGKGLCVTGAKTKLAPRLFRAVQCTAHSGNAEEASSPGFKQRHQRKLARNNAASSPAPCP
jgi:hypothetical protein